MHSRHSDVLINKKEKLINDEIVKKVAPEVPRTYLPHSVDSDIFKPLPDEQIAEVRNNSLQKDDLEKVIFFWNNRNAACGSKLLKPKQGGPEPEF